MKKTFPVNINGNIFYIDEDAYKLLLDYLSQLRATFPGEEGEEIVGDIESRISEHFDERVRLGANVIVLEDVNRVIETMGRPEELSDSENEASDRGADSTEPGACPPPPHSGATEGSVPPPPIHKRLYRDVRHEVFGGVIAGLAQYTGWDVTVMRILAVVLTVCTYFWPCVIIYLLAWMIIPVARTPREILEMQGQPVTLDNVGQTVINNATPPAAPVPSDNASSFSTFINTFFSIVAKFILGFFAIIFGLGAIALIGVILATLAGITLFSVAGIPDILQGLDFFETNSPVIEACGRICTLFAVLIPFFLIARYSAIPLLKLKAPSKATIITSVILEAFFIIGAVVLLAIADHSGESTYYYSTIIDAFDSILTPTLAAIPTGTIIAPCIAG